MKMLLPAAEFGTTGLAGWISDNIIQIMLLIIVAVLLGLASNGKVPKFVTVLGLSVGALAFLVLSLDNGKLGKELGVFVFGLFVQA
ncbi:MAG: hypothetical protein FWD18_01600 [Micrococcales bacterium]|nr:hypothetical protein [Micrococcales bacterium]